MGAAAQAGIAALVALVALVAQPAAADDRCTARTGAGDPFAACFDIGNRIFLSATTSGFGGAVDLRHSIRFDDEPDLSWRLEHRLLDTRLGGLADTESFILYSGRYIRHARDGHIVLPLGIPKKIFLPFDVGAEAEVGGLSWRTGELDLELGLVRVVGLIDLARSEGYKKRLAIGALASWAVDVGRPDGEVEILAHAVAPFSLGLLSARLESENGLTVGELTAEGGREFSSVDGWSTVLSGRASAERTVLAINDRPISLFAAAEARGPDPELVGEIGIRFSVVQRRDRRVRLTDLVARQSD